MYLGDHVKYGFQVDSRGFQGERIIRSSGRRVRWRRRVDGVDGDGDGDVGNVGNDDGYGVGGRCEVERSRNGESMDRVREGG